MTIYHQRAIELKYKGYTYYEISKQLGGKISPGMLGRYFMHGGMLDLPYMQYEAEMNKFTVEEARNQYKKMTGWTYKAQMQLYKEAVKIKDYRLALDIIKDINDRGDLVVVKKTEVKVEDKDDMVETYEQFAAQLRQKGIDPTTGLRMEQAKVGEGKSLQA